MKYAGHAGRMHAELLAAESRLSGARQNFKAALADAQISTCGIFSETTFVPRRLMTERIAELEAANSVALKAVLANLADPDDPDDKGDDADWEVGDDGKRRKKAKKRAAPVEDEPIPGDDSTSEPDAPDHPVDAYYDHVRATAAAIIAAGAKRRGEI